MEKALKIWQEAEMPQLNLKTPWYGYPLGLWDEEDDRLAEKVAEGEYFQSKQRERTVNVAKRETSYEMWLKEEGIPVIEGYGVEDVTVLPREPWQRTGGSGAYIDLKGMEGFTGMYVCEIPPGGALNPESHLYEELIYILSGFGATEIWSAGDDQRKMHFEWQQGSLFAMPLNTRHRMINGSRDPVFFSP